MAKSRNRPKYKVKKKKKNIENQKRREYMNTFEKGAEMPRTFVYNKEKQTVEVPINAWQTLNQAADQLRSIAMFVTTMEIVGQQHITDGTLLPVYSKDLEPTGVKNPDGSDQLKIKDAFWDRVKNPLGAETSKSTIVDSTGAPVVSETTV